LSCPFALSCPAKGSESFIRGKTLGSEQLVADERRLGSMPTLARLLAEASKSSKIVVTVLLRFSAAYVAASRAAAALFVGRGMVFGMIQ